MKFCQISPNVARTLLSAQSVRFPYFRVRYRKLEPAQPSPKGTNHRVAQRFSAGRLYKNDSNPGWTTHLERRGRTRPSQTDDTAAVATPPAPHRAEPRSAPPPLRRIRSTWEHTDTKAAARVKPTACTSRAARERAPSFHHHLLRNHVEGPCDFFHHGRKFRCQHRFLRIDHHIDRRFQRRPPQPHSFAQPSLNPIALDRATQHASDRKANARSALRLSQVKHGHVRGKVPLAQLVDALEIGMLQQPRRPGKPCSTRGRGLRTPVTSVCAHFTVLHQ